MYEELSKTKHGMTYSNTLNKIYLVYKWPIYRAAPGSHKVPVEEVLHYNAAELLKVLDKDTYGNFQFYSWLQELSQKEFNPVALKLSDFPYRLIPRGVRPRVVPKPPAPSSIQMVASASRDSDDSGSINSDASSRAGKLPRGRPSGKKSSLRLVSKSRKRIHAELESGSDYDDAEPKRSHYFDDGDAMDVDVADASSPEETSQEPIKIVLRAEKVPSIAAHGPNEVWICEEEECGYVVRGGDAQDCQDRVKKHFEEHERQTNMVELAVAESRGHMPVKYAYFPPFLILVEMPPPTYSLPPSPPPPHDLHSTPSSRPRGRENPSTASTDHSFHSHISRFRRRPHPVSDSLGKLTRAS